MLMIFSFLFFFNVRRVSRHDSKKLCIIFYMWKFYLERICWFSTFFFFFVFHLMPKSPFYPEFVVAILYNGILGLGSLGQWIFAELIILVIFYHLTRFSFMNTVELIMQLPTMTFLQKFMIYLQ